MDVALWNNGKFLDRILGEVVVNVVEGDPAEPEVAPDPWVPALCHWRLMEAL